MIHRRRFARFASVSLLGSASLLSLSTAAGAHDVLFSSSDRIARGPVEVGREIALAGGVVQLRLDNGAVASFVDSAQFSLRSDGGIDLRSGSVTVVNGRATATAVHMPDGVRGMVEGAGAAARFTATATGTRGGATAGSVVVSRAATSRRFTSGQFWAAATGAGPDRVIATEAAAVPGAAREVGPVRPMRDGGIVAAAENGIPIALGEALAAVGARGDIVAAARRIEAFDRNPTIASFPTGDYSLLVGLAAQGVSPLGAGSVAFNGAAADIVRTYFQYLAAGNSGPAFRTAYAGILVNYLDLIRAGVLPSSFGGATQAQLNAYIGFIGRTEGFGALSASNRQLLDAYLAFLSTGGSADAFGASVTALTASFLNFVRGGGNPASFTQASSAVVAQYLAIVQSGGLRTGLSAQNQALLAAYLANNGIGFTTGYASGLAAFVAYLNTGGLPSAYTVVSQATLRSYLETLDTTGLFDSVLGTQASFLRGYLSFLRGGGTPDQFNALPANIARVNAAALTQYVDYLLAGGVPSAYTVLTQAQIRSALDQLTAVGQFNALLGANAAFLSEYAAYLRTGADADAFAGLPSVDLNAYAGALGQFASFLRAGNRPSGYTALTAQQQRSYLTALQTAGKLTLLGSDAALLGDYLAYLRSGGAPDAFAGLPIVTYQSYAGALATYFTFLNGGGLPSSYSALTQAQVRMYLDVLRANGQFALLGNNAAFYTDYLTFLAGGGAADAFANLPIFTFQGYATALNAYLAYLNAGGLPSNYGALSQAQVRQYLDALSANPQLTALLGGNAAFFTSYRAYLLTGGSADAFAGLPIVTFQSYAAALNAYYTFLVGGGSPSAYSALSQAQIRSYLDALKGAGQVTALLGSNATFFTQYLAFLETGGSPNAYPGLPSSLYGQYATALTAYFAYLNGGGLPSGYTALTQAQIREYLSVLQANNQLAALLGTNATFFANYLTFVTGGGSADAFSALPIVTYQSYASALNTYYAYLVGGGLPANYTALSQAQIRQYLDALASAGQVNALLGSNAQFFTQYLTYLAGGGTPNGFPGLPSSTYGQYAAALGAYFAYLNAGGLPSGYTALTQAQIREYLSVLQSNNQLTALLGANATFFANYLSFVAGGGSADAFSGLPVVTYRDYASALTLYFTYLSRGGAPANYAALTQAQIRAYLDTLQAAGQTALLGANAEFFTSYLAYLAGGGAPGAFPSLPANIYAGYGSSLGSFAAFLRGGGLPADYTALSSVQIREYLAVLAANGQLALVGGQADVDLLNGYAAYLAAGGVPNQFTGLPAFVTYEAALRTYYAFLQGGGLPSTYTALTQAQIVAYIRALDAAGLVAARLTSAEAAFLRSYASFVGGGGAADQFAGLPGNQPTSTPVVTQGLATAPRGSAGTLALAVAGKNVPAAATTTGNVVLTGNVVNAFSGAGSTGVTSQSVQTVEARTVDSTIAIARLSNGTYNTLAANTANANEGVHLVWGTPATAVPMTGTATFGLVTATQPTVDGGAVAPGTFAGNLAVNLASRQLGWDSVIGIGGVTYRFASAGGLAAPSVALVPGSNIFNAAASTANNGLAGTGTGFLSGPGGIYAGFSYTATAPIGTVEGAAVFGKGQAAGTLPAVTYTGAPQVPANLPAPNYSFAPGLATNGIAVRSTYPTATGAGTTVQTGATVTRDAAGALLTSSNASTQDLSRGTARATDVFGDTRVAVGRWFDGTYRRGPQNNALDTLSATQSLHYVQLAPGSFALPTTGQINYTLLAATQPTYNTGATGAGLFDARMAIAFGSSVKVALEGTIRMPEAAGTVTYSFATPGGVAGVNALGNQVSTSALAVTAPLTGSGLACTTACQLNFTGGYGGSDAFRVGGVYFTSDARANAPSIEGAAIFTGTQAPLPDATTLTGQRVAFVSAQNSNLGTASPVELNAAGAIQRLAFSQSANVVSDYRIGTAVAAESGVVAGVMAWTRWAAGAPNGFSAIGPNEGIHIVTGTPATALPVSGMVAYALIGSTRPTDEIQRGAPGTITGSAAVLFGGTPRVGLDLNVAVSGKEWKLGTTGGLTNIAQSQIIVTPATMGFTAPAVSLSGVSGGACSGFCTAYVGGGLFGAGASHMGLTYVIQQGSGSGQNYVTGSASFAAAPVAPVNGQSGTFANQLTYTYAAGSLVEVGSGNVNYDAGALKSYVSLGGATRNAGIVQERGRLSDVIGWARWTGDAAGPLVDQPGNRGLHIMSGTPTTVASLPASGTVQYTMVGGTNPTLGAGTATPGTLTGTLGVAFGTLPRIGFDLTATVGDLGWRVQTTGGSANPATSQVTVGSQLSFSGQFGKTTGVTGTTAASCVNGCTATIGGQMYGAGASHIGVAFNMIDSGPAGVAQASAIGIFAKTP